MRWARTIDIAGTRVGENERTYIIAEAGVAHFGSPEKAFSLVDMAVEAEADAVKFQILDPDELFSAKAGAWRDRLASRCLDREVFCDLKRYAAEKGIDFSATPHDLSSLEFLLGLDPPFLKIGSGEVENWIFYKRAAETGKPLIISTGMYREDQVEELLALLQGVGNEKVILLHCVTAYPTAPDEVNLRLIEMYHRKYGIITGYSDHTAGWHIPLAAVNFGASLLEKHISLDFDVPNANDWKVSCNAEELKRFIHAVRDVEAAQGDGRRIVSAMEQEALIWARKSLTLRRDIAKGEVIRENDLVSMRPGTGISPKQMESVVGAFSLRDMKAGEQLQYKDIKLS